VPECAERWEWQTSTPNSLAPVSNGYRRLPAPMPKQLSQSRGQNGNLTKQKPTRGKAGSARPTASLQRGFHQGKEHPWKHQFQKGPFPLRRTRLPPPTPRSGDSPSQRSTRRLADAAGHASATTVQLYGRARRALDGYSVLDMTSQDASVVMAARAPCDPAGPSRWASTLSMIKR
jgi:hypothetical protein